MGGWVGDRISFHIVPSIMQDANGIVTFIASITESRRKVIH